MRSFFWRAWHRLDNRRMDIRARLAGACNADTWREDEAEYHPGYSHWRCGKAKGHIGLHRFRNYTWGSFHGVEYSPIEGWSVMLPFDRYAGGRHPTYPWRRARLAWRAKQAELSSRRKARMAQP